MYLVTSDQMQALDGHAIHDLGVPGIVLMDYAGKAVADVIMEDVPERVVVCTGKGNNGGDGWIAARWCRYYGVDVEVVSLVGLDDLTGDALLAATGAVKSGVPWRVYDGLNPLPSANVYVDALLGTGTSRPLTGLLLHLVEALGQVERPIVAVDIPTGVHPSTGEVHGSAVQATRTVCFAAQKLGTAISPGCHFAGQVVNVDIGIPITNPKELAAWTTPDQVRETLPTRVSESHKGTYGRVGIAVGEMQGAATLAGKAAFRTGVGLVVLLTERPYEMTVPEFIVRESNSHPMRSLTDCDALVYGPGLGAGSHAWQQLLTEWQKPVVVDADGLREVRTDGSSGLKASAVLTPHPKECARMLGWSTSHVQAHRLEAALCLAKQTSAVVVLKGYHSLIAHPDGTVRVNPNGDASLAKAGTGDVLSGMIGSLLAQGVPPFDAACTGAWLHGRSGELAGQELTPASVMASDVVESISRAIRSIST